MTNDKKILTALVALFLTLQLGCGVKTTTAPVAIAEVVDQELSEFEVPTDEPGGKNVAQFGVAIEPATAPAGSLVTLGVRARIMPEWHIYAIDKPTGVNVATTLKLTLPEGLEEVGEWKAPEAHAFDAETFGYEGDVTFRRFLRVKEGATGPLEVKCDIGYQTCTKTSCLAPASTSQSTT
ncbi:MAG: protein-disulfide reductase DsbD domain-containing protein [Planctomycetota bacterium]